MVAYQQRYFEDYQVGAVAEFGETSVTESEIIEFAKRYDPQVMHVDPVAAIDSAVGGLVASGWLTVGLAMRMMVDHYISTVASLVSPGIDELRWTKPVRPNDVIRVRITVLEARPSQSKPDRGVVRSQVEVVNQLGETVLTMKSLNLLRRRCPDRGVEA